MNDIRAILNEYTCFQYDDKGRNYMVVLATWFLRYRKTFYLSTGLSVTLILQHFTKCLQQSSNMRYSLDNFFRISPLDYMFSRCKMKRDNLGNSQIIGTQMHAPGDNAGKIYFCLYLKMMTVIWFDLIWIYFLLQSTYTNTKIMNTINSSK